MQHTSSINKFDELWHLVGNTPMIAIDYLFRGRQRTIYAKCEHYNLTGSIKDRMALYILQQAYITGALRPGDPIVEATSGNTGIAFSAIGRALGHHVTIIMPDWLSKERFDIIRSLGAEVRLVSKRSGGFLGSIRACREMADEYPNIFLPDQFENLYNCTAHAKTTAREIALQLASIGRKPDAFVAGVGTGGTVMGVATYFREHFPETTIHPLEPLESPTLTTGFKIGSHRIQGISDEFIPSIVQLDRLDAVLQVSDGDAIVLAQMLSRQLGLAVGISSGANVAGAIKRLEELGGNANVVTVLPDSNKKYLSTDLLRDEPLRETYISAQIQFIGFRPIRRSGIGQPHP